MIFSLLNYFNKCNQIIDINTCIDDLTSQTVCTFGFK